MENNQNGEISFFQVEYSRTDKEWHIKEILVRELNAYYSKEEAVRNAIELAQTHHDQSNSVLVQREDGVVEKIGCF